MKKAHIFLIRRRWLVATLAIVLAAGIFYVVNWPASVTAATTQRQLPIYSVECSGKRCAISFDAAWGDVRVR